MRTEHRVVDNRIFLLGLDDIYRSSMKVHEREELLQCAREVAQLLSVSPANVPIEGYYTEDEQLTEYFLLMRALQDEHKSRESELHSNPAFRRLKQVTESRIFGRPDEGDSLLPAGRDALFVALDSSSPENWSVESLTKKAHQYACESDDFSLVALAALSHDSVVLAALRESVVLYAELIVGGVSDEPEYVWEVDEIIEKRAQQFVTTFNELFDDSLPEPVAQNAEIFWDAGNAKGIIGRCVRIGSDDSVQPVRHYHWAIDLLADNEVVRDFWDFEVWTTERYTKVNDEQEIQDAKHRVVELARAIIDGSVGIIEGAQQMVSFQFTLKDDNDPDFLNFIGIDSETPHLPVGDIRKHWSPDALHEKDKEIRKIEEHYRKDAIKAARNLIKKYG